MTHHNHHHIIIHRLKYLLSQSDIFSHFGAVKADTTGNSMKPPTSTSAPKSVGSRGKRATAAAAADELDDDERALADEEADEDDASDKKGTVLLKQPSCVSGGAMRAYQLEGLNWMIRLQENGINGILADEMGLGKTLQTICLLAHATFGPRPGGPHLVVLSLIHI